jgi:hypothetical protein
MTIYGDFKLQGVHFSRNCFIFNLDTLFKDIIRLNGGIKYYSFDIVLRPDMDLVVYGGLGTGYVTGSISPIGGGRDGEEYNFDYSGISIIPSVGIKIIQNHLNYGIDFSYYYDMTTTSKDLTRLNFFYQDLSGTSFNYSVIEFVFSAGYCF